MVSHPLRGRLPIYAALGVPEVWLWRAEALTIHRLADGAYVVADESIVLPGSPFAEAERILGARHAQDETTLLRGFRAHVRTLPG